MQRVALSSTPANMHFAARNPEFDLRGALGRDWHGGRAFPTAFFNALSFSFPSGEKFFVDSVKHYLPRIDDEKLKQEAAVFVQQEYTHRREHQRYNRELAAARGLDADKLESLFIDQVALINKEPPIVRLAATVVLEHITAIFAAGSMRNPRWLDGADSVMVDLWRWHGIEETEHKSVAFDVFLAVGGKRSTLRQVMRIVRVRFPYHVLITIWRMRRMEGKSTLSLSFWREGYRFLFGRDGILSEAAEDFRLFYRDDFHPWMIDNRDLLQDTIKNQSI